jgi:hypothetical protein
MGTKNKRKSTKKGGTSVRSNVPTANLLGLEPNSVNSSNPVTPSKTVTPSKSVSVNLPKTNQRNGISKSTKTNWEDEFFSTEKKMRNFMNNKKVKDSMIRIQEAYKIAKDKVVDYFRKKIQDRTSSTSIRDIIINDEHPAEELLTQLNITEPNDIAYLLECIMNDNQAIIKMLLKTITKIQIDKLKEYAITQGDQLEGTKISEKLKDSEDPKLKISLELFKRMLDSSNSEFQFKNIISRKLAYALFLYNNNDTSFIDVINEQTKYITEELQRSITNPYQEKAVSAAGKLGSFLGAVGSTALRGTSALAQRAVSGAAKSVPRMLTPTPGSTTQKGLNRTKQFFENKAKGASALYGSTKTYLGNTFKKSPNGRSFLKRRGNNIKSSIPFNFFKRSTHKVGNFLQKSVTGKKNRPVSEAALEQELREPLIETSQRSNTPVSNLKEEPANLLTKPTGAV